jgi:hypothetical protein
MLDNKIVSLKLADKKKDKTLIEVLEQIIQDWKDEDNQGYNNFRVGALIVETESGMRIIPLKDETTYHYIGMVEVAKVILVDSIYDDCEED